MRRILICALLALMCLYSLSTVEALNVTGLTVTLTCTGGHFSDFNYTFNRDNTGTGKEAFQIIVTDAGSNVVHLVSNSLDLGTYSETGADLTYNLGTAVPGAVVYQWVSQAGNGFDEQVAFSYTGFCGDTPTATPTVTPTPTETPTPTVTPGASPTPTPTITPTANYIQRATVVYGDNQSQDVAIVYQITVGEIALAIIGASIFGVMVVRVFLEYRRQ